MRIGKPCSTEGIKGCFCQKLVVIYLQQVWCYYALSLHVGWCSFGIAYKCYYWPSRKVKHRRCTSSVECRICQGTLGIHETQLVVRLTCIFTLNHFSGCFLNYTPHWLILVKGTKHAEISIVAWFLMTSILDRPRNGWKALICYSSLDQVMCIS